MSKFSAQHYNAIAKDIRLELTEIVEGDISHSLKALAMTGLVQLALRFVKRFEADNELFDPLKFLDACSPDSDLYPLSELWED